MGISQKRSRVKETGKVVQKHRKKRQHELGRLPIHTKIGEKKLKVLRTIGGNKKYKQANTQELNLYDPKTKSYSKVKIKSVMENPANRHFVRRNILTKGTVVDTEKGKAKIVSRPGQEATLNGVLV